MANMSLAPLAATATIAIRLVIDKRGESNKNIVNRRYIFMAGKSVLCLASTPTY